MHDIQHTETRAAGKETKLRKRITLQQGKLQELLKEFQPTSWQKLTGLVCQQSCRPQILARGQVPTGPLIFALGRVHAQC